MIQHKHLIGSNHTHTLHLYTRIEIDIIALNVWFRPNMKRDSFLIVSP